MNNGDAKRESQWDALYPLLLETLRQYGKDDNLGRADFHLVDDDWGTKQHKVEIQNLALMTPPVIAALQRVLGAYPDWAVVISVAVPEKIGVWPPMGLIVRAHEVVDGLRREYFPPEYRQIRYAGSRPGTDRD